MIKSLQAQFGIDRIVKIIDCGVNFPVIQINNKYASASIALHGAQLLTFQPHGQEPVLWLSRAAVYQPGKSLRGGIPVCWPWFSAHPTHKDFPAHGFARNYVWTIRSIKQTLSEATQVSLVLNANEATRRFWPQAFELVLKVLIDREISVALEMTNRSEQACRFSSALHSYLRVGDVNEIEILGLENTVYLDKLLSFQGFTQKGGIRLHNELDRIYEDTAADIVIRDDVLKRRLKIRKSGSRTTVVWNPWITKSAAMSDFEEGGYNNMVCVEAANAAHDTILLQSGQSHCLQTMISVLEL